MEMSDYKKTIFELVRNNHGIVRSEISRRIHVSKSTAERIVQSLVTQGLVSENLNNHNRSQGRAGIALSVNPNGPCIIGVELSANQTLTCAGINLDGEFITESFTEVSGDMTKEQLFEVIEEHIHRVFTEVRHLNREIIGIGFGDPGIVDSLSGVSVLSSTLPNWKNARISERLSERFHLPVFIQGDMRMKCLAEARYGVAVGVKGFIFINFGIGVGLGVYSNGRLYLGEQGCGCEMGHMIIDPEGPICGCGGKGCLEAIVGSKALITQTINAIQNGVQTSILEKAGMNPDAITAQHVFKAAEEHDRLAVTLVDSAIQILGRAIGNVCNLFNPSLVVLGGEIAKSPVLWQPVQTVIRRTVIPFLSKQLKIEFSRLSDKSGVLGAAEMVIEKMLYTERRASCSKTK